MESEQLREMTTKSHQPSRQSSTLLSSDASTSSIRNDPPQTNTGSILRLDSSIGKVIINIRCSNFLKIIYNFILTYRSDKTT